MPISPSNNDPTLRGNSAKSSGEKTSNVIFIARWAQRYTTKEGARVTGMTPNGFRKLRDGQNSISFDKLTLWCRNDKDFAAAYAAHVGLILPGEAGFAAALTKTVSAYHQMKSSAE